MVLGALTGAIVFRLSGLPDTYLVNFIALGMAGVLTAVVRAPLMSVILVVEMTGSFSQLLMITVAAFCAYQLAEWLRVIPVYETLYANLLAKQGQPAAVEGFSEPVLSEFILVEEPSYLQQPLQDLDFPVRLLITEVQREGISFTPQGSDQLHAQDRLKVLHDARDSEVISHFFKGH